MRHPTIPALSIAAAGTTQHTTTIPSVHRRFLCIPGSRQAALPAGTIEVHNTTAVISGRRLPWVLPCVINATRGSANRHSYNSNQVLLNKTTYLQDRRRQIDLGRCHPEQGKLLTYRVDLEFGHISWQRKFWAKHTIARL